MKHLRRNHAGFTLLELVVVVIVIAILAAIAVPKITGRVASSRDARRMQDILTVRDAIEQYFVDKGTYPTPSSNANFGGWDVSTDGDFIPELVKKGYLKETPADPLNDATYHYRYFVYGEGSYGCVGKGPFYVLGLTKFETQDAIDKNKGYFKCSQRDWNSEFDYVTGGGASLQ